MADGPDDLLPTQEVARLFGKGVATINRWATEGHLSAAVQLPGRTGARLYRRADVEALLAQDAPARDDASASQVSA